MSSKNREKVANKNCRSYVEDRKEFEGSNLSGYWCGSNTMQCTDECYVVYSYGFHFPIYIYDDSTKQWFGNKDKYSTSTSKQQTQARPQGVDITWLSTVDMSTLVFVGYREFIKRRLGVAA